MGLNSIIIAAADFIILSQNLGQHHADSKKAGFSSDPNKVVKITDSLPAKTLGFLAAHETSKTVTGPIYGTVYRRVAYVK